MWYIYIYHPIMHFIGEFISIIQGFLVCQESSCFVNIVSPINNKSVLIYFNGHWAT